MVLETTFKTCNGGSTASMLWRWGIKREATNWAGGARHAHTEVQREAPGKWKSIWSMPRPEYGVVWPLLRRGDGGVQDGWG